MGKIFNVIGACCLLSAGLSFSSCKETYDEEELDRDIQKKLNEKKEEEEGWLAKTTDVIVLEGDTLKLPVRVTPEKIEGDYIEHYSYYIYHYDPSEKDAIKESLFRQTALLSEYGNFDWLKARINGHSYGEPLKEYIAGSESSTKDNNWYFVDSNNIIKEIVFEEELGKPHFTISDFWCQISEDGTVQVPAIEPSNPITPN